MLLHWYAKLDHMNFKISRDLSPTGYIPKLVKFSVLQQERATSSKTDSDNKIVKGTIVKFPGDIVHMDQVELETPGRPFTFSGRNN